MATVADVALRLGRAADNLADPDRVGVQAAAVRVKRVIEASRNQAVGSDGALSGVKNGKLGVKYKVQEGRSPNVLFTATGPWQFIEYDTKSAGIVTGKVARIKGRGARRLTRERDLNIAFGAAGSLAGVKPLSWAGVPGGHPWARVKDAPTKGQKPWAKGVDRGTPVATAEIKKAAVSAVRSAF